MSTTFPVRSFNNARSAVFLLMIRTTPPDLPINRFFSLHTKTFCSTFILISKFYFRQHYMPYLTIIESIRHVCGKWEITSQWICSIDIQSVQSYQISNIIHWFPLKFHYWGSFHLKIWIKVPYLGTIVC